MRLLAAGLAIAIIIFVVSGGHVILLPLLFLPLGMFSLGRRRRHGTLLETRRASRRP
jgi:type III secretory pathway component EscT